MKHLLAFLLALLLCSPAFAAGGPYTGGGPFSGNGGGGGGSGLPSPVVNGDCIIGSGGAAVWGSCAGSASANLGASLSAASPQISGDATSGFYSSATNTISVASSGVNDASFQGPVTIASNNIGLSFTGMNPGTLIPMASVTGFAVGQTISGTNIVPGTQIGQIIGSTPTSTTCPVTTATGSTFPVLSTAGFAVSQVFQDVTHPGATNSNGTPYPISLTAGTTDLATTASGTSNSGQSALTVAATTGLGNGYMIYDTTTSCLGSGAVVLSFNSGTHTIQVFPSLTANCLNGDTIVAYPNITFENVSSPGISSGDTITSYPTIAVNASASPANFTAGNAIVSTTNNHSSSNPGSLITASGAFFTGDITVSNGISNAGGNLISTTAPDGGSIAIGAGVLPSVVANALEPSNSVGIGFDALNAMTVAYENIAIGGFSQFKNATANHNVAIGYEALFDLTGGNGSNVAIGGSALQNATTAAGNACAGGDCLGGVTTGGNNTALGQNAGNSVTTGSNNLVLGENVATGTLTTGSSNILIGTSNAVTTPLSNTSNYLNIGATITGSLVATSGGTALIIGTSSDDGAIMTFAGEGAIILPAGTTAQRPSPANGMLRYNSSTPGIEAFYSSTWNALGGGSTTTLGSSAAATNPQRSGEAGTGFYSATDQTVAVAANGIEAMQWNTVGSGVDYLSVTPGLSGTRPQIAVAGSTTNQSMALLGNGTGGVAIGTTVQIGTHALTVFDNGSSGGNGVVINGINGTNNGAELDLDLNGTNYFSINVNGFFSEITNITDTGNGLQFNAADYIFRQYPATNTAFIILPVSSQADYIQASGSAAGTPGSASLSAIGGDTNINLVLNQKGSGGIVMGATQTPADNATCMAGTFWWDTGFIYVCTASGTVKRATLSTY